jgi:hypothetical protein
VFNVDLCSGRIDIEAIVTTLRISDILYHENRIARLSELLRFNLFRAAPTARILSYWLSEFPGQANWHSGVALGLLLRKIGFPEDYWEEFAANFAESWLLRGWRGKKLNKRYEQYLKGVLHTDGDDIPSDIEDDAVMTEESDGRRAPALNNTIMAKQDAHVNVINVDEEQALINAQLHAELAEFLWNYTTHNTGQVLAGPNAHHTTANQDTTANQEPKPHPAARPTHFTRPRSSSLFTFSRPPIPGPATDWEASDSRDVTPALTERSALDTFTTELLAKAEEVSTMGSFGRGPSTNRGVSEVSLVERGADEDERVGRGERGEQEGQEGYAIIDLLSDNEDDDDLRDEFSVIDLSAEDEDAADDDDKSVEDLGLEIVGSRSVKD